MTRPQLILSPGREKFIDRRHPWIFSGAVMRETGDPHEGDLVDVVAVDGRWLAVGHYQPESIRVKVLSYTTPDIDEAWWRARLASAIAYRRQLGLFNMGLADLSAPNHHSNLTDMFRLIHAEGDFLPGLVADYYNGALVLQAHSMGMYRMLPQLAAWLGEMLGDKLRVVFNKSAATLPDGVGENGFLLGDPCDEWEAHEQGHRYLINFREGQKTGFFLDQRDNRALLSSLSAGRRVLNCFGYTGGFSLAALHGGARYVETVDISKRAIELCDRHVELNYGAAAPHRGVVADVLQYIPSVSRPESDLFDIVILDPPAFAKSHKVLQQALKGYRAINRKALELLPPGGLLFTFSCSQAVSRDEFQTMVFSAANLAGRQVRIVRHLAHGADHPVSIHHPEGEYLKGLLLQVDG
ncbi:MAG: SAM-dependent methyltransferase [bacterium P3]|nr:MAG: SAM-dependent methyltransferase [bacterium P3]KWW42104.1 MAG: SAM-dependent methyltransferase [bacterium F083]